MRRRGQLAALLIAATSVSAIGLVQIVMADGIERPARREAAIQNPLFTPASLPESPDLLGGAELLPPVDTCIGRDTAMMAIAITSEGEAPETVHAALSDFSGASADAADTKSSVLAERLRTVLGASSHCAGVQQAVSDALLVAELTDDQTGAIGPPGAAGEPDPEAPGGDESTVPPADDSNGSEGSGYTQLPT